MTSGPKISNRMKSECMPHNDKQSIGTPRPTLTLLRQLNVLDRPAPARSNPRSLTVPRPNVGLLRLSTDFHSHTKGQCLLHLLLPLLQHLQRTHLRTRLTSRLALASLHTQLLSFHQLRSLPQRQIHTPRICLTRTQETHRRVAPNTNRPDIHTHNHHHRPNNPVIQRQRCHLFASSHQRASTMHNRSAANSAPQILMPTSPSTIPRPRDLKPQLPRASYPRFHLFQHFLAASTCTTCPAAWFRARVTT